VAEDEQARGYGEPVIHPPLQHPLNPPAWHPDEDERRAVEKLIEMEPDLTKMVRRQQAWGMVWDILIKIGGGLTAISGGFLIIRELLKAAAK